MKRIDIQDFRKEGYLQELNRQFLHPLGLALEIIQEEDGTMRLGGVWDYRDDLEGIYFAPGEDAAHDTERVRKMKNIENIRAERDPHREDALGYIIQPFDDSSPDCQ